MNERVGAIDVEEYGINVGLSAEEADPTAFGNHHDDYLSLAVSFYLY
jgi:hypothetical protein